MVNVKQTMDFPMDIPIDIPVDISQTAVPLTTLATYDYYVMQR